MCRGHVTFDIHKWHTISVRLLALSFASPWPLSLAVLLALRLASQSQRFVDANHLNKREAKPRKINLRDMMSA
jgi:hypothetical protein